MKRLVALLLTLVMAFSLVACADSEEKQSARKHTDKLTEIEKQEVSFVGTVVELNESSAVVMPVPESPMLKFSDRISFGTAQLETIDVELGSIVQVVYTGEVMESYPAQVNAIHWSLSADMRHMDYTDPWIDKTEMEPCENDIFRDIVITRIYKNCFFANTVVPMPYQIKLNGQLSEDWCVGDQVICTYENTYYDTEQSRIEADMLTIQESDLQLEPGLAYKPVIYLYPQVETQVSVSLALDGSLTCTYPAYENGWQVTAFPDGTLQDATGQTYNYLYWEGQTNAAWDLSQGFCVKGEDTAAFLETSLAQLGLTRREANEFIVYWLPLMEQNPYNIIAFQSAAYTDAARLQVSPAPDTVIRVFMTWQPSQVPVELPAQTLTAPERTGFTLVEWGGTALS